MIRASPKYCNSMKSRCFDVKCKKPLEKSMKMDQKFNFLESFPMYSNLFQCFPKKHKGFPIFQCFECPGQAQGRPGLQESPKHWKVVKPLCLFGKLWNNLK